MEEKKVEVNIIFKEKVYIKINDNIKNLNFVKCCDLLILKEYEEFEKLIKKEYYTMDNCIMIIDVINSNDVDHFKYILKFIHFKNLHNILLYCFVKNHNNLIDYIMKNNPQFNSYVKYIELSINNTKYYFNKYINKIKFGESYPLLYIMTTLKIGDYDYGENILSKLDMYCTDSIYERKSVIYMDFSMDNCTKIILDKKYIKIYDILKNSKKLCSYTIVYHLTDYIHLKLSGPGMDMSLYS